MKKIVFAAWLLVCVAACKEAGPTNGNLNIVTTTSLLTDLVNQIGDDKVNVQGLMGSGVDPHLYKASAGDVTKLSNADLIFYSGLHLEGKLVDVFEKMERQNIRTIAVSEALDEKTLIGSELFASNYDPHIWFNVHNWELITSFVVQKLSEADPENKEVYEANGNAYLEKLKVLDQELRSMIETLPKEKRILVTAHDAFNYFGQAYGFEVVGLQGLSTATEAGVQDVQNLSHFIIEKKIKAIFVESSVPRRTIEALQAAVNSKNNHVEIGGTLYSDALGNAGTVEGTYIGMFKYNVNTIVEALR